MDVPLKTGLKTMALTESPLCYKTKPTRTNSEEIETVVGPSTSIQHIAGMFAFRFFYVEIISD